MIFSVNDRIVYYNSGIEHAEFKRTKLFHRYHQPTKILLDYWDPLTHYYLNKVHVPDDDVISMYDYYQHAVNVKSHPLYIQDLSIFRTGSVDDYGSYQEIQKGKKEFYVYFFNEPGYQNRVRKINYFYQNECLYTNYYDVRGFLNRRMYYANGYESKDLFFTPRGQVTLKKILFKDGHNNQYRAKYYVRGFNKPIYTRAHLILHFFNLLCLRYKSLMHPVIFIADRWWRNRSAERIFGQIKYPHYTAYYAHYSHTYNDKKAMTATTYSSFKDIFQMAKETPPRDSYDALICSTSRQANDIKQRFRLPRPMFTIPVGVQDLPHNPELSFNGRWPDQITCVTRVSPVEGLLDTVRAFGIAKQSVPKLKLVIYGKMGPLSQKFINRLKAIERKYHFNESSISLRNYTTHVLDVYSKSRLTLVTAPNDAFNISLLEALSQGCPAIVYTNNYGPRDMVKNGFNGYKVNNDYNAMANKIVYLFNHSQIMKKMSINAYRSSNRFSEGKVWAQYKKLIHDAKKKWFFKLI